MDSIPENAIQYGHDGAAEVVYVGQSFCDGLCFPAQINPKRGVAMVVCETGAREVDKYTYVCGNAEWVPWTTSKASALPDNVIVGGYVAAIASESSLCFGRGIHNGVPVFGHIFHCYRRLITEFQGRMLRLEEFDVLVRK